MLHLSDFKLEKKKVKHLAMNILGISAKCSLFQKNQESVTSLVVIAASKYLEMRYEKNMN